MHSLFKKTIFLIFCLATLQATAAQPARSVEEFLKNQEVIRVLGMDFMGMGDLAASANVMQQLRSFGYEGRFEFVYTGDGKNVSRLFGLPDPLPDGYLDEKNKTRFFKIQNYFHKLDRNEIKRINFSVSGAFMYNGCAAILRDDPDDELAKQKKDTIMCNNLANFSNSDTLISINNFPVPIKTYDDATTIYQFNQEKSKILDDSQTYFATPVASFKEAIDFLQNNPQGQDLVAKKPALKELVKGIDTHQYDVMALYGWDIRSKDAADADYAGNILQIISAARLAQLNGATTKPLVFAVFYNYETELVELNKLIQNENWDAKFELPGAVQLKAEMKKLKLAEVFSVASLADANTVDTLKKLKPGQILLLSVGSLPKTVFDGLFTHVDTNMWPPVREGASSFSSLLLSGRPHFRCGGRLSDNQYIWEMGFDNIKDPALKKQLETLYAPQPQGIYCNGFIGWNNSSEGYKLLADLMQQALKPRSSYSQSFIELKADVMKLEKNRVYQSIKEVIK